MMMLEGSEQMARRIKLVRNLGIIGLKLNVRVGKGNGA